MNPHLLVALALSLVFVACLAGIASALLEVARTRRKRRRVYPRPRVVPRPGSID